MCNLTWMNDRRWYKIQNEKKKTFHIIRETKKKKKWPSSWSSPHTGPCLSTHVHIEVCGFISFLGLLMLLMGSQQTKKRRKSSGACHRYSQAESFFFFFLRYSSLEYTHTPGWENTAAAASQPIVCVYIASDMPYRYLYTTTTTTNEEIFLVIYFYFFLFFNILLLEKDEQQQQQQLAFMNR